MSLSWAFAKKPPPGVESLRFIDDRARRRLAARVLAVLLGAAIALVTWPSLAPGSSTALAASKHKHMHPSKGDPRMAARAVACMVNQRREMHGLSHVRRRIKLRRPARGHTGYMVRHNCYSHQCSGELDLIGRIRRHGYFDGASRYGCGETIDTARRHRASPMNIVRAWMHSSEHRSILLSRGYLHIGIGVAWDSPFGGRHWGTYTADLCYRHG